MANIKFNESIGSNWITFLLSPFIISFFVSAIIILLFFPAVTKYKLTITESHKSGSVLGVYCDLVGDGFSDAIYITQDTSQRYSIMISEIPSGTVNQWNFTGKLLDYTNDYLIIGDFDLNHKKEIYFLSQSHDSIMLNCISDLKNNAPTLQNIFIAKIGKGKWNSDPCVVKAQMDDLTDDGFKELIFAIKTGFELTPRNVYAYNIKNNKLMVSPYYGLSVSNIVQQDITGDGKNEILLQGYGPDNISDTSIHYHDRSAWLIVLDRTLNFLFKPVEFKGAYTYIFPFVFERGDKQNQAGFYVQTSSGTWQSKLAFFSKEGTISGEKEIPGIPHIGIQHVFTVYQHRKQILALIKSKSDELVLLNQHLEIIETRKFMQCINPIWLDIDRDSLQEIVFCNLPKEKLLFTINDLSDPVIIDLKLDNSSPFISIKENGKEESELVIWDKSFITLLNYKLNPLYYLKWVIYLGVYIFILLFIWLIRRLQRYQIEQNLKIEKKITELQMKIVKNQLDPHFTLNAVNSIIYAVGNNEPERVTEHLYYFSNLYRHLLLTADQYKCKLEDELSFTENYLKMEQLRFREKYSYDITVQDEINQNIEVPKMCIQTAVENSLKHGIAPLKSGGEITINVISEQNNLVIEIRDNGIGRDAAKENQHSSTHKGIKLTQQYFELFKKITNRKVTSDINDLMDDSGNPVGTKVRITIQIN